MPVHVRKGQTVFYHTYALHRSSALWGEDAGVFRPERWAELRRAASANANAHRDGRGGDEKERLGGSSSGDGGSGSSSSSTRSGSAGTAWKFVPFGGGGRICPGRESSPPPSLPPVFVYFLSIPSPFPPFLSPVLSSLPTHMHACMHTHNT